MNNRLRCCRLRVSSVTKAHATIHAPPPRKKKRPRFMLAMAAATALVSLSCGEGASAPPAPMPRSSPPPAHVPIDPAPQPPNRASTVTRLRRLGNIEIENVVTDLTGQYLNATTGFLEEPRGQGYDTDAASLGMSESKLEEINIVADRVASFVTQTERLATFAPCPAGNDGEACAREVATFVAAFARRAWGRPVSAVELERLTVLYKNGRGAAGDHAAGVSLVVEAMILSPHFIYVTELGEPAAGAEPGHEVKLTGVETASVMSLQLVGARPDASLLEAGLRGDLDAPEGRRRETARLVDSPAGRRQLARFVRSWLYVEDVAHINKDIGAYPDFTPAVRAALDRELTTFLEHVQVNARGRLEELFFADYTFPGPALARIYGDDLLDPIGDFTRVRLRLDRRRGLLASPGFLARHALVSQTNPVERGLIVRNRLFCQDVPGPPPSVAAVPPGGGRDTTTRAKYERHITNEFCRECHKLMDPIGFGLEQFDPLGRFRTHDGVNPVNPQGELAGTDVDGLFVGPVELADRLRKSAMFRRCAAQQLYRFTLGRAVDGAADRPEVDYLAWRFDQLDQSLPALMVELVARDNFNLRRIGAAEVP